MLFQPTNIAKAHASIDKLSNSFPEEPAFQFSHTELTYFESLTQILSLDARQSSKLDKTMDYLQSHICTQTAKLASPPMEFGFKFDWNVNEEVTDVVSESLWNYSSLGRYQRIQKIKRAFTKQLPEPDYTHSNTLHIPGCNGEHESHPHSDADEETK